MQRERDTGSGHSRKGRSMARAAAIVGCFLWGVLLLCCLLRDAAMK